MLSADRHGLLHPAVAIRRNDSLCPFLQPRQSVPLPSRAFPLAFGKEQLQHLYTSELIQHCSELSQMYSLMSKFTRLTTTAKSYSKISHPDLIVNLI